MITPPIRYSGRTTPPLGNARPSRPLAPMEVPSSGMAVEDVDRRHIAGTRGIYWRDGGMGVAEWTVGGSMIR